MLRLRTLSAIVLSIVVWAGCQSPPGAGDLHASNRAAQAKSGPVHDLSRDEEAGGHTLRKHVGRTDEQLQERLQHERNITAASTYTDREAAERVVGAALAQNRDRIERWLERQGGHPNLVLDYDGDSAIGRSLRRGEGHSQPCSHAVVVLRWAGPGEYYVLTSYPECR